MSSSNKTTTKRKWRGQRVGGFFQTQTQAKTPEKLPVNENIASNRRKKRSHERDTEHYKRILWTLKNMW